MQSLKELRSGMCFFSFFSVCYQPVEAHAAVSLCSTSCLAGHVNVLMLKNALVNINSPGPLRQFHFHASGGEDNRLFDANTRALFCSEGRSSQGLRSHPTSLL